VSFFPNYFGGPENPHTECEFSGPLQKMQKKLKKLAAPYSSFFNRFAIDLKAAPQETLKAAPQETLKAAPQETLKAAPQETLKAAPQETSNSVSTKG